jgi:hypothetical protein
MGSRRGTSMMMATAAVLALAACGGRENDARNPANNQPIGDTLAAKQPGASDTAVVPQPPSAMGDSSARAHGGTGATGVTQGASTGTSEAGTRAASGDSTGKH